MRFPLASRATTLLLMLFCIPALYRHDVNRWFVEGATDLDGTQASNNEKFGSLPFDRRVEESQAFGDAVYSPVLQAHVQDLVSRQECGSDENVELKNNEPAEGTINPGQSQCWTFPQTELDQAPSAMSTIMSLPSLERISIRDTSDHVELKKRDTEKQLHITLSVCTQPVPTNDNIDQPPPQLQLFISWSNTNPGSGSDANPVVPPVEEGFAEYSNGMSDSVYIKVQALSSPGYNGSYTYELTGSIDTPYSKYIDDSELYNIDSDSNATFLTSTNLTNDWKEAGPKLGIFVHNQEDPQILGLRRSFCGLTRNALISGNVGGNGSSSVEVGLYSQEVQPMQHFFVPGLNKSSSYYAMMGLQTQYEKAGPGTPGGGGTVWKALNFSTKSDENCQLLYNLTFCSGVNYAVPSNPSFNQTALAQFYDGNAKEMFQNFSFSLQQIPCNTTDDARYSLAANCYDCEAAYKQWLCAVTIPRCADYSSREPYLQIRNVAQDFVNGTLVSSVDTDASFSQVNRSIAYMNSSRNPLIDETIRPGPYKEVLPCGQLCYNIVQKCPSALQFACPYLGKTFNQSYGYPGQDDGVFTCNIPGATWSVGGGPVLSPSRLLAVLALVSSLLLVVSGA